jgi:hypothetical protein
MKKRKKQVINFLMLCFIFMASDKVLADDALINVHEWRLAVERDFEKEMPHFYASYQKLPPDEKLSVLQNTLRADEEAQNFFSEADLIQEIFPDV